MYSEYSELLGKVFTSVKNVNHEELVFTAEDGSVWKFYHEQDCCESVMIDDICGDLSDLVGEPLILAEESISDGGEDGGWGGSSTWTFYRFATRKGYVTVKWFGTSNGYYSESVHFTKVR